MSGSFSKRGKTWEFRLTIGRNPETGRRQTISRGGFPTKKAAKDACDKLSSEQEGGRPYVSTRITFGEFLSHWLEKYAKNLTPKTYQGYELIVRKHLTPALGAVLLRQLSRDHIDAYYVKAQRTLSVCTVLQHHRCIHKALESAVAWKMAPYNAAHGAAKPSLPRGSMKHLDDEGARVLLAAAEGSWAYMAILLAMTTGMRRGEVAGLQWSDVNLSAGVINLQTAYQSIKGFRGLKDPKTKRGRSIKLPQIAVEALMDERLRQEVNGIPLGFVVCNEKGKPWHPDSLSDQVRRLAQKNGLSITFHGLRHTHASSLLLAGIHAKVVQERLGHSSIGVTLDIYSHLAPGMQDAAAVEIENVLRPKTKRDL